MTLAQQAPVHEAFTLEGAGWRATIYFGYIYVACDPEAGDTLPDALEGVLTATQRKVWTVEWSHEDDDGWQVYLLDRQH